MTDHDRDQFVDRLLDAGLQRYSAADPPPGLEQRLLTALRAAPMSEEPVDKLLDTGLARYSAAEPRPGLEQRLLAGLSRPAGPQPSRWLDWRLAGALATGAVAVLVIVLFLFRQPPPPMPPQTATSRPAPVAPAPPSTMPAAQPSVVAEVRPAPHPNASRGGEGVAETRRLGAGPRLETFPAPAPLSEQERLLLSFIRHTPKEQLMARQLGAAPIERLEIQPLFVPRLEIQDPTTEN